MPLTEHHWPFRDPAPKSADALTLLEMAKRDPVLAELDAARAKRLDELAHTDAAGWPLRDAPEGA